MELQSDLAVDDLFVLLYLVFVNKWIWILLLLAAFNIFLLVTYLDKRKQVSQVFRAISEGPPMEEYAERSERIITALKYHPSVDKQYREFVEASEELEKGLLNLTLHDTEDPFLFFAERGALPQIVQDSLWNSFNEYRKVVDILLEQVLPTRHAYFDQYLKAIRIVKEARGGTSDDRVKQLQLAFDSVVGRARYNFPVTDHRQSDNFLYYLETKSNPAEELRANNLLQKIDGLYPSKDKMYLYGKVYNLSDLTAADKRLLLRYWVRLKSEVDGRKRKSI